MEMTVSAAGPCPDPLPKSSLQYDTRTGIVWWKGSSIQLTPGEFKMLVLLAEKRYATYEELYASIRGEGFLTGDGKEGPRTNARGFMKRIRMKFREVDPSFHAIENRRGFGYRWVGDPPQNAATQRCPTCGHAF